MKRIAVLMFAILAAVGVAATALAQVPPSPPAAPAAPAAPAMLAVPPAAPVPAPAAAATPAPPALSAIPAAPAPPAPPQRPPSQARPPKPPEPAKAPDAPQPPEPRATDTDEPVNVRFEVTVSSQTGTGPAVKRSAIVTAANREGSGSMLRSGNNVPVASTTFTPVGGGGKDAAPPQPPVTSYNYRAVGLNVDVNNVRVLPGNRVRALLNVEFSGVDDKSTATPGMPAFPTFSQRMTVFLDHNKPLVIAQSSDYVDNLERKQTVEVKATILR